MSKLFLDERAEIRACKRLHSTEGKSVAGEATTNVTEAGPKAWATEARSAHSRSATVHGGHEPVHLAHELLHLGGHLALTEALGKTSLLRILRATEVVRHGGGVMVAAARAQRA